MRPPPKPAISSRPRRLACVSLACISRGFLAAFFQVSSAQSPCIYMIGEVIWNLGSTFFGLVIGWLVRGSVDGGSCLFVSSLLLLLAVVVTAVHS